MKDFATSYERRRKFAVDAKASLGAEALTILTIERLE